MGTSVPSGEAWRRMPLAGASISIAALSVSMSKSGSPFATEPPSATCQAMIRPAAMSMSTLGMMTSVGIRCGPPRGPARPG